MHIGIFAKTFVRSSVEETMEAVAAHGLHCVQWNFSVAGLSTMPERLNPDLITRIRHAAQTHQIELAALSGTFNMIDPDTSRVQRHLKALEGVAAACAELGIPIITLCTGSRDPSDQWRWHPENRSPRAWRDLTMALRRALEIAEDYRVTLAIEPEPGNVVDSACKGRRLLDEMQSPLLKIVMDGANLLRQAEPSRMQEVLQEAFALLGDSLVLAHAKDFSLTGDGEQVAAGSGLLDYDAYLHLLSAARYTGPLILHGLREDQVDVSVAFLQRKLAALRQEETSD
ncbi:MAG TPA: sugar phosphate isomerase/epimerase [Ktedonobacteraceae bacterium]|nr:sugar phosphate isomerase/epimerase [Ktedonobacteraceae bacterium]